MLFTSAEFIIFILILIPVYYLTSHRHRWMLLLASSTIFYINWSFRFVPFLLACILINYFSAIIIEKSKSPLQKKVTLIFSLVSSLSFIFFFKYYLHLTNVLGDSLGVAMSRNTVGDLALPIGISFYTFQAIGYTLDVYWKRIRAEKHFGFFALFVCYFPQILCGPLEQAQSLIPQLKKETQVSYDQALDGLVQMLFGFLKKLVIADNLIKTYQIVYSYPDLSVHSGQTLILSALMMSFVLYFDFSGYCDIALGVSKILGIKLSTNFRLPYLARSFQEIWERWHITISLWIKNHLRYYLVQHKFFRRHKALVVIICFIMLGQWHGAGLHLSLFGLFHGMFWNFEKMLAKFCKGTEEKLWRKLLVPFQHLWVFAGFTILGTCLIAGTFERTMVVWSKIFLPSEYSDFNLFKTLREQGSDLSFEYYLFIVFCMILTMIVESVVVLKNRRWPRLLRWIAAGLILVVISLLGSFTQQKFIYYHF